MVNAVNRGRYKLPAKPSGRESGNAEWHALDSRQPCRTARQMHARIVADGSTEDTCIQTLLERFWRALRCPRCRDFGDCGHRDRRADLAEILAEREA